MGKRGRPRKEVTPEQMQAQVAAQVQERGDVDPQLLKMMADQDRERPRPNVEDSPAFKARQEINKQIWDEEKKWFTNLDGTPIEDEPKTEEPGHAEEEGAAGTEEEAQAEDQGAEPREEAEPGEAEVVAEAEESKKPEPEEQYVEVKIDGQVRQVPLSQIVDAGKRTFQKESSADWRLEQATRLLNEAKEREQARLSQQDARSVPPLQAVPDAQQQQKITQLFEAMRYGDETEGQKAVQEIIHMARTPTPEMDKILAAVQYQIEVDRVREAFRTTPDKGGYADLWPVEGGGLCEDPFVTDALMSRINRKLESGRPNVLSTYREAADEVRRRFQIGEYAAKKPTDTFAEKREKKRTIDVVRGVQAKTPPAPEPQPEGQEDIVAWHRKRRGQI